jgi:hypothetical protein
VVEILNGNDKGPLAGWAIVQSNGLTLVGKMNVGPTVLRVRGVVAGRSDSDVHTPRTLSPVFEMKPNIAQARGGANVAIHPCFPVWLLDVQEIEIPDGAIVVPVESLHKMDREGLASFVEKMMQNLRAEQ